MTPRTSRRGMTALAAFALLLGSACSSGDGADTESSTGRPPATDASGQPIDGGSLSRDGNGDGTGDTDDTGGDQGDSDGNGGSPSGGGGSPGAPGDSPDTVPSPPGEGSPSPDEPSGNGPDSGPNGDGSPNPSGGSDGGPSSGPGGSDGEGSSGGDGGGSSGGGSNSGGSGDGPRPVDPTTTTTEAPQAAPLVLRVNNQSCSGGRPRVSLTAGAGRGRQANLRSVTVERQNEYGAWLSSPARWLGPETGGNADQWTADSVSGQRFGTTLRITAVANDGQRQTVTHNITGGC